LLLRGGDKKTISKRLPRSKDVLHTDVYCLNGRCRAERGQQRVCKIVFCLVNAVVFLVYMFVATNLNRRAKPMIRLHTKKERKKRKGQRRRVTRRRRRGGGGGGSKGRRLVDNNQ
jgi:hypothetical protein